MKNITTLAAVRTGLVLVLGGAAISSLGGCMSSTPVYDQQFGDAVRTVRAMQILNPDASANMNPVNGIDARAASSAMDRYNSSYRTPQSDANAFTVGVGTATSGLNGMGR